jgi:hypothetical protein
MKDSRTQDQSEANLSSPTNCIPTACSPDYRHKLVVTSCFLDGRITDVPGHAGIAVIVDASAVDGSTDGITRLDLKRDPKNPLATLPAQFVHAPSASSICIWLVRRVSWNFSITNQS